MIKKRGGARTQKGKRGGRNDQAAKKE